MQPVKMNERELDPEESLAMIHSMIRTARNKLANDGFLFIFWGWLIFIGALSHYYLLIIDFEYGYFVWPFITPIGAIVSILYGIRHKREVIVKTYIDRYMVFTWSAFMLAIAISMAYLPLHGIRVTYFFAMLLYGIATLITGGILNFRPMIICSFFSFLFACVSPLTGTGEHLLLLAGCMLCSYIIPGHILRYKYYT